MDLFILFLYFDLFSDADSVVCNTAVMYDGHCDVGNKYSSCYFDGFDCCLSSTGGLTSDSCTSFQSCDVTKLEDNVCQPQNNNTECMFDLGKFFLTYLDYLARVSLHQKILNSYFSKFWA